MITKEMIKNGIQNRTVTFMLDPNAKHGTVCKIGDNWFYFGGETAEEENPEEHVAHVPQDDVVDEIYDVLEAFVEEGNEFQDEYDYYEAVLKERGC